MRNRKKELGFTLIEVTIAVLILSAALVTLLGLQYSLVQREYRDQQMQRAMLSARRLLARMEIDEIPPELGTKQTSLKDLLELYAPEEINNLNKSAGLEEVPNMDAELISEDITLPGSETLNNIRRNILRIRWGNSELDIFEVVYFAPNDTTKSSTEGGTGE